MRHRSRLLMALVTGVLLGSVFAGCASPSDDSAQEGGVSPTPSTATPAPDGPSGSASDGPSGSASDGPSASASDGPSGSASKGPPDGGAGRLPAYAFAISRIGPQLRERMRHSHRSGCPVPLRELRHLRMSHVGFDGQPHQGEMVVHADVAEDVVRVFRELYEERFPIRRMRLVDEYAGDDDRSMAADNTSAYNCRRVAGTQRWSEHAYGRAIDVNPVENPYVRDGSVAPPEGRRYADLDRSTGASPPPGVVHAGGPVVTAFRRIGWGWGGDWVSAKDYQHFSANGS